MTFDLADRLIDALIQLLVFGILGGGVTWLYARLQRNRELRLQVLREFSALHGRFLSLRFRFNSFYIEWPDQRRADFQPLGDSDLRAEKWRCYKEACNLLGEFQGIKPLVISNFPQVADRMAVIHAKYHDWRRRSGGDRPILQKLDGENESGYTELRNTYEKAIREMRERI